MSFTPTTVAETTIAKPKRWDEPFGPMTDAEVARLLQIKPFRHIDPSRFPPNLPLEGIVRNDMRVVEYESGDLVVREGDYGNSAFMILHGRVRVALERLPADIIGEPPAVRRSVWSAIKQLWGERQLPEVRRPTTLRRSRQPAAMASRLGSFCKTCQVCSTAREPLPSGQASSSANWPPSLVRSGPPPCSPRARRYCSKSVGRGCAN